MKESNLSKSNEDTLEEKQKLTDVPAINNEAPERDVANQFREFLKIINIETIKSRKVVVIKNHASLQKMISFVVYSSDRITSYSVNMVRWAGRASLVIMNQEEEGLNTYTSKDSDNVSCPVLDTALGGAKLYSFRWLAKAALINLFETYFSTLFMDTRKDDKDAFVKTTGLGGAKLYEFTFMVQVAIISVLWEILLKLVTTLIWQKRHSDQITVVEVGNISFLKAVRVLRGECKVTNAMKNENKVSNQLEVINATYSPSPKFRVSVPKVMVADLIK